MVTRKTVRSVDTQTGEVISGVLVEIPFKIRLNKPFCLVFQDELLKLDIKLLGSEALNVLFYMISTMDYENKVPNHAARIAEALGVSRQSVSKSIGKLKNLGYITCHQKIGNTQLFEVSPNLAWKGRIKNLQKRLARET
jgi:DNA-binding transcriptional ArsR family regulator